MALNKALASSQTVTPALPAQIKSAGELARRKIYSGIPDDDVALALAICQKYGFDPLLKHLVLIAGNIKDEASGQWYKRYNAYVTRDGLLHVAHASGQLDGMEVLTGKDDIGEWAEALVYRKDMGKPFRYRVYMSEYAREPKGAWKTHPRAMLTKTAEVFTLRRAFDVAITPVEEMGFEVTECIPVETESSSAEQNKQPQNKEGTVESTPAPAGGQLDTRGNTGKQSRKNITTPDWPDEPPAWMTEQTGTRQAAVNRNGNGNGNGRRRLF